LIVHYSVKEAIDYGGYFGLGGNQQLAAVARLQTNSLHVKLALSKNEKLREMRSTAPSKMKQLPLGHLKSKM